MKKLALGLCFSLLAACVGQHETSAPLSKEGSAKIFGGSVASQTQYSAYAAILYIVTEDAKLTCTATPILPRFMLVSAHCLDNAKGLKVLFFAGQVTAGILRTWPEAFTRTVKRYVSHPRYHIPVARDHGNPNDIAILELNEPMPAGMATFEINSRPINLASDPAVVGLLGYGYEKVFLRGGKQVPSGRELFRFATQTILPGGDAGMFLLDGSQGQGSCAGDSGGPVFYSKANGRFLLVGLTTTRLAFEDNPDQCAVNSLAVDVSYHLKWMTNTIQYLQSN